MTTEPASTTAPSAAAPPAKKLYTLADLKAHASEAACWVLIHGKVYDVTPFLDEHPGGFDIILSSTGALLGVVVFLRSGGDAGGRTWAPLPWVRVCCGAASAGRGRVLASPPWSAILFSGAPTVAPPPAAPTRPPRTRAP